MEMPENCKSCRLCKFIGASPECALKKHPFDTVSQYYYADKKPSYCPVNCQLPEGHGRLVDKDEMLKKIENYHRYMTIGRESDPRCIIEDSLTIVPAERRET
jgi:hypothetical protein